MGNVLLLYCVKFQVSVKNNVEELCEESEYFTFHISSVSHEKVFFYKIELLLTKTADLIHVLVQQRNWVDRSLRTTVI